MASKAILSVCLHQHSYTKYQPNMTSLQSEIFLSKLNGGIKESFDCSPFRGREELFLSQLA